VENALDSAEPLELLGGTDQFERTRKADIEEQLTSQRGGDLAEFDYPGWSVMSVRTQFDRDGRVARGGRVAEDEHNENVGGSCGK